MNELKKLMLKAPRLTVAVAESITCGRIQARIGSISGASEFFRGGVTAYSLEQKVRHLGVDRAAAETVDSVSLTVAGQMAAGVCALFGADVGVATTGYAEPYPERGVTAPYAWWAVAGRMPGQEPEVRSGRIDCPGASRTEAQDQVAEAAFGALLAWLKAVRGQA